VFRGEYTKEDRRQKKGTAKVSPDSGEQNLTEPPKKNGMPKVGTKENRTNKLKMRE
jgi:hypothetical protein